MFKTLRFSFKKSKILRRIRKAVELRKFDAQSILENAMKSAASGKTMSDKDLYTEELLTLLSKDKATINLLADYKLKFDDLRSMIYTLEQHGAGQVVKGHYVAVSSIAFIDTLNILCNYWENGEFKIEDKSKSESNDAMAYQMLQSF
tara:strand:- start:658 stop:1098 length:441 start_codon:yes stop_codon:yes gene_type:complete